GAIREDWPPRAGVAGPVCRLLRDYQRRLYYAGPADPIGRVADDHDHGSGDPFDEDSGPHGGRLLQDGARRPNRLVDAVGLALSVDRWRGPDLARQDLGPEETG